LASHDGNPGVIYDLRHRTTYSYADQVSYARCVLRLTPISNRHQSVLDADLKVSPRPSSQDRRRGPFGEQMLTVIVDKAHNELVIEATSRVEVHAAHVAAGVAGPPWESVREAALAAPSLDADGPADPPDGGDHRLCAGKLPARTANPGGGGRTQSPHPRRVPLRPQRY
jgi:transglutaminase-like putative cysteine protease